MASRRAIGHWLILLLLSVLFSSLLLRIHLPAALLLGPLIAGLILSLRGVKLSIPRPCYLAAQAIVGCMIARAINPSVFGVLFNNWALVLPMLLGALAQGGGWLMLELPEWLLAMAYAVLGWTVGLQFNKAIFLLALKTLPQIIASIIGLILMCALMALALTHILQMDFMTAYLATSPGGLDTVAIIAAGTRADMSFIMALQTLRLFTILLTGPAMARAISRYAPRQ